MDRRFLLLPLLICFSLVQVQPVRGQSLTGSQPVAKDQLLRDESPRLIVEQGPVLDATLYADGRQEQFQTIIVTRPMCGSDLSQADAGFLRDIARAHRLDFEDQTVGAEQGGQRGSGLDIVFVVSNPPAGAQNAIDAVEAYIETVFTDNVVVTININFAPLGDGILGSTSSSFISPVTYTTLRNGLVNGMDTDDFIQLSLPNTSTIPVRFDGTSGTVTNQTNLVVNRSTFNATIGAAAGNAASMTISSNFSWDYDPSNGVMGGSWDFQSVLVHEVGHALGFVSAADDFFGPNSMTMLDIYRFQFTDGGADFNPDTLAEFGTTARLVDFNTPNNDHNSDLISVEYLMSDGSPRQASHFFDQNPPIGIMDPTIASGVTFFPDFFKTSDIDMFDAIGWDFSSIPDDLSPPSPNPMEWDAGGEPAPISSSAISMTAALATDPQNPSGSQNDVEYCFTGISGPGVGSGCWQASQTFTDTGLVANTIYSYEVSARDTAIPPNETAASTPVLSATTFIQSPLTFFFDSVDDTSMNLTAFVSTGSFTNLTVGDSGVLFEMTPAGGVNANVWVQAQFVGVTGLTPGTEYAVRVKARNQFGVETPFTATQLISTTGGCTLDGDVNQDGLINGEDIDGYLRAKLLQAPALGEDPLCADFGNGGDLALDTADFVNALLAS